MVLHAFYLQEWELPLEELEEQRSLAAGGYVGVRRVARLLEVCSGVWLHWAWACPLYLLISSWARAAWGVDSILDLVIHGQKPGLECRPLGSLSVPACTVFLSFTELTWHDVLVFLLLFYFSPA